MRLSIYFLTRLTKNNYNKLDLSRLLKKNNPLAPETVIDIKIPISKEWRNEKNRIKKPMNVIIMMTLFQQIIETPMKNMLYYFMMGKLAYPSKAHLEKNDLKQQGKKREI